jgi:hypothetical protein
MSRAKLPRAWTMKTEEARRAGLFQLSWHSLRFERNPG